MVKNLPAMWKTQVQSLGWEYPLEKEMATHFSILAWRIPQTKEPAGLSPSDNRLKILKVLLTQSCWTVCDPKEPTRLLCPLNFPGMNIGVSCYFLFQRIFPTQGLNLHLLHQQVDSLPTDSYQGSPRMLECVAYPFSSGSS